MKIQQKIELMTLAVFLMSGSILFGAQKPVYLGTADNFVILSESGITCISPLSITGNIGVSPIAAVAIRGFRLILDGSGLFSTASQVKGKVYASDYNDATPSMMTMAVNAMQTAYLDAAGRTNPDIFELGAGEIGGNTLSPGLYKWSTGVSITKDVTLNGGPDDVWIFQSAGVLSIAYGVKVILKGGAQARNVFWQTVACTMGESSHLEGIVLSASAITLEAGATVTGRLLAQTVVTLQMNTVTQP